MRDNNLPEQARMKNADDLVVVVVDGLTKTCDPEPTPSKASLTSRQNS